jgi:aryl-alcohol dehydrogenase-like predicted oxidoreductase
VTPRRILLPGTGLEVSRVGFGTGSLHHILSARRRVDLLAAAAASGITHFDSAPYYGYGLAERDIGRFLRGRRSGFTVATKVGLYPLGPESRHVATVFLRKAAGKIIRRIVLPQIDYGVSRARDSLTSSLRRLGTDHVDFLFLHEPTPALVDTDEMLAWLGEERREGRIRAWGIAGVRESVATWVSHSHPLADVVQTQDSLRCRQADFLTDAGRELQFTYGYLSGRGEARDPMLPADIIRRALDRNSSGSVLVSTRNKRHLESLASALP